MFVELTVAEETKGLGTGSSKDWLGPADSEAVPSESGQDVPLHGGSHGDGLGPRTGKWKPRRWRREEERPSAPAPRHWPGLCRHNGSRWLHAEPH